MGDDDTTAGAPTAPTAPTVTGPDPDSFMTPASLEPGGSTHARAPLDLPGSATGDESARPAHSLLVIEDDTWDARLLQAMLQGAIERPLALTHAGCLEDAIAILRTREIQLVLTDLQLPDSAAGETVPRLREAAPDTPVIVLSGYADDDLQAEAMAAGALAYLVKGDVNNLTILQKIMTHLDELPDLSSPPPSNPADQGPDR